MEKIVYISKISSLPLLLLIRGYQKTLSPDHGPLRHMFYGGYCRFYPTCSEYGYGVIEKFGLIKGLYLTTMRVLRCHPWAKGGYEPIPK